MRKSAKSEIGRNHEWRLKNGGNQRDAIQRSDFGRARIENGLLDRGSLHSAAGAIRLQNLRTVHERNQLRRKSKNAR